MNLNNNWYTDYKTRLLNSKIVYPGFSKGTFFLLPNGYILWESIKTELDRRFKQYNIKNVKMPSLIPFSLLNKEKEHFDGFNPECLLVKSNNSKNLEFDNKNKVFLRPTSEVLFYALNKNLLSTYNELPIKYNQWCNIFRNEKNTSLFLRSVEFYWQEGHTIHSTDKEAEQLVYNIWNEYKDFIKNYLDLYIFFGKKTKMEKFKGSVYTLSVESLLTSGKSIQLATSHFLGQEFSKIFKLTYKDSDNSINFPFSTSWGTSTRLIGTIFGTFFDELGVIFPWNVAPVQIAIVILNSCLKEDDTFYIKILSYLNKYRVKLYNEKKNNRDNILSIDKEGCPIKLIIGKKELEEGKISIKNRLNLKNDESILVNNNMVSNIEKNILSYRQSIYNKSKDFFNKNIIYPENKSIFINLLNEKKDRLFLIPFCNSLECEKNLKTGTCNELLLGYSFRCIEKEIKDNCNISCFLCIKIAMVKAYIAKSY